MDKCCTIELQLYWHSSSGRDIDQVIENLDAFFIEMVRTRKEWDEIAKSIGEAVLTRVRLIYANRHQRPEVEEPND